jgi:putative endonuclease
LEETHEVAAALAREKEIKGWLRAKKIALIESINPEWLDLSLDWYEPKRIDN